MVANIYNFFSEEGLLFQAKLTLTYENKLKMLFLGPGASGRKKKLNTLNVKPLNISSPPPTIMNTFYYSAYE